MDNIQNCDGFNIPSSQTYTSHVSLLMVSVGNLPHIADVVNEVTVY
jgi:hypothetical protein